MKTGIIKDNNEKKTVLSQQDYAVKRGTNKNKEKQKIDDNGFLNCEEVKKDSQSVVTNSETVMISWIRCMLKRLG